MSPLLVDDGWPELREAMPQGWIAYEVAENRRLDGRVPITSFSCEFIYGVEVEGGIIKRYMGKRAGNYATTRRVTVYAEGSRADLVAVAALLPDLHRLAALRWPIDWRVDTVLIP